MKHLLLNLSFLFIAFVAQAQSQTTDSLDSKLAGYWEVQSIKFAGPVDINHDGKKSADALDEYSGCQKDLQMELSEDKTAKIYTGTHIKDCKPEIQSYTWKVVKRMLRESKYVNGKRIVNDRQVLVLILRPSDPDDDSIQFLIQDVGKKSLNVKAEMRDGSDSTSEAEVVYKRVRKNKIV